MLVFLSRDPAREVVENHHMTICPGGHLAGQECPSSWFEGQDKPKTFHLHFVFGECEVDDELGKYLVDQGMATKTRLIRPRGLVRA